MDFMNLLKKYKGRVEELKYLKYDTLLLEFLTEEEIEVIIKSYEQAIEEIEGLPMIRKNSKKSA